MVDNLLKLDNYIQTKELWQYSVKKLQEYSRENILRIFKKFSQQINEIYGWQKRCFLKLLKWDDRDCFILEVWWKPIWVLAYKNVLQNEIPCVEWQNWYIELKSFFLFDEFWKGNVRKLRETFVQKIKSNFSNSDWILVSVSKKKADSSLQMFLKLWFKELYEEYNKYNNNDSEVFLYYPLSTNLESKEINLGVKQRFFDKISIWEKTVEWRCWKSYNKIKKWDIIQLICWGKTIRKKLKNVVKYNSIDEFLQNEWVENALPWVESVEEWKKIYYSIPHYKEKIEKYWIFAFRF